MNKGTHEGTETQIKKRHERRQNRNGNEKRKQIKAYDDEEAEDGDVGNTEDVGINNRPLAVDSQQSIVNCQTNMRCQTIIYIYILIVCVCVYVYLLEPNYNQKPNIQERRD